LLHEDNMRTTLDLDDHVMQQAKLAAQQSGATLTAFVEDALRERLARRRTPRPVERFRVHTFKGRGLRSGVDLDNSAGLRDLMDGLA
jgi:hypothetical protein